MADSKLVSPGDLRQEAQKLIVEGKMPPLENLLAAVAGTRQKYSPMLKAARRMGTPEEQAEREARKKAQQQNSTNRTSESQPKK